MAGRERTTSIKCVEPACGDHAHYAYRNQTERAEIDQRQAEHPYECLRHRDRHEVLRPDNLDRMQVLIASKVNGLPDSLYWWPEGGEQPGSGLVSAPGFRAHANDFPEGTRLTIAARIELPGSEEERMSEQTSGKPPLPTRMFDPFPRITVDESEDSPFRRVLHLGVGVANNWALGPDGPYQKPGQAGYDVALAQVREALLHLLELGFIDIDVERLMAAPGYPLQREPDPVPLPLGEEA